MLSMLYPLIHTLCLFLTLAIPKCIKAVLLSPTVAPAQLLPLLLPDLAFVLLMESIFLGLHALSMSLPRPRLRQAISLGWTGMLVFSGLYSASELRFFQATGAFMDAATFVHGLRYLDQLKGVIIAEMSWQWGGAVVASILLGVAIARLGLRFPGIKLSRLAGASMAGLGSVALVVLTVYLHQLTDGSKLSPLKSTLFLEQVSLTWSRVEESLTPVDLSYPVPERITLEETPETHKKNVVIILLESTRFDATTPYNPSLNTTPTLARIAREGARVERAYVALPHTTKALVSVLSGFPPDIRRPLTETTGIGVPGTGLATLLKSVGYSSAYFNSSFGNFENNDVLIHSLGFDQFSSAEQLDRDAWESPNYLGVEDRAMTQPIMGWVDQQKQPFLLTILTLVSHHDYKVPTTFPVQQYEGSERLNEYLNAVRYVDGFVGEVFSEFEKRGLLKDTIFVFLGDHGEGHGEHGRKGHDQIMYEEGIRIPMLIYDTDYFKTATVVPGLRYNLDIMPTILELLGLKLTRGSLEGKSLLHPEGERVIHSSCWIEDQCIARLWDHQKYIHYYGKQADEYFQLDTDARETINRIDELSAEQKRAYVKDVLDWRTHVRKVYATYTMQQNSSYTYSKVPDFSEPLKATFEPSLEVVGFDVSDGLKPGGQGTLTLYYRVRKNLVGGWKLCGEMLNTQGTRHKITLNRQIPDIEPESMVPDLYYKIQYAFSLLPRASVGRSALYLFIESSKDKRREVSGINAERESNTIVIPITVEE